MRIYGMGRTPGRRKLVQPLIDTRIIRPTETALALKLVTEMDLLRLKTLARLHARALPPDVSWEDLLQEALTRVLTGDRKVPSGVSAVAFLAGVMRSLRSEHWRRFEAARGSGTGRRRVGAPSEYRAYPTRAAALRAVAREAGEDADPAADPERSVVAMQELKAIERLFADDPVVLGIIDRLGEGLAPEQIRSALGLSKTDYDSARRRMRRRLLREGLTCEPR
jgi:DNA-directed RNA polymerase specialized sigma24 family protein